MDLGSKGRAVAACRNQVQFPTETPNPDAKPLAEYCLCLLGLLGMMDVPRSKWSLSDTSCLTNCPSLASRCFCQHHNYVIQRDIWRAFISVSSVPHKRDPWGLGDAWMQDRGISSPPPALLPLCATLVLSFQLGAGPGGVNGWRLCNQTSSATPQEPGWASRTRQH